MSAKILINASDPEEIRVATVKDGRLEEFRIESAAREITQGNIYKDLVARVEPSLQAVFVDYGAERNGFLQKHDIHDDYYHEDDARDVPLHRLVKRGQGVMVQIAKDPYEQSEVLLGDALRGVPRDRYFLSGKLFPGQNGRLMGPREVRGLVERSLRRLRTHELDLLQLHRVTPQDYESARDHVLPELEHLREEGKVRFLGITESTSRDPQHRMALRALRDDAYDTIMVAYHPANMLAEQQVFPRALARDVGVIAMAAARHLVPRNRSERLQLLTRTLANLLYSPPRDRSRLKASRQVPWHHRPLGQNQDLCHCHCFCQHGRLVSRMLHQEHRA